MPLCTNAQRVRCRWQGGSHCDSTPQARKPAWRILDAKRTLSAATARSRSFRSRSVASCCRQPGARRLVPTTHVVFASEPIHTQLTPQTCPPFPHRRWPPRHLRRAAPPAALCSTICCRQKPWRNCLPRTAAWLTSTSKARLALSGRYFTCQPACCLVVVGVGVPLSPHAVRLVLPQRRAEQLPGCLAHTPARSQHVCLDAPLERRPAPRVRIWSGHRRGRGLRPRLWILRVPGTMVARAAQARAPCRGPSPHICRAVHRAPWHRVRLLVVPTLCHPTVPAARVLARSVPV